ncbi:nuclease-related domain-containing protein [Planococcus donghaensis]|uniref:NERD nuclease n=1 Tax=Planococcus donghaensis TaxID=414778 RepID=A0A1C7EGE2_9BACL|nr:nuclease-related domain-containing protein [Planococcus donghaensis]ANU22447.1 NERD nuclease [Planococcus donghaensis]
MIIKYREKPIKIAGYEALLKRISPTHPKRAAIKNSLNNARAGFAGEERLDEALDFFDPPYAYQLIQDFSLPAPYKIQVDTVLITQSCVILLEVKNITGKLQFKQNPSALYSILADGEIKSYKSPVTQMNETAIRMGKFLKTLGCNLPISSLIVIAHPSQIVQDAPSNARILAVGELNFYLSNLHMPKPILSTDELYQLGHAFLAAHQNYQPFPLAPKFQIEPSEIEGGVFCPRCHFGKMTTTKVAWECEMCRLISKDAHIHTLYEWFMLIKPTINTAECRDFIGLKNLDTAKRFLLNNNCQPVGGRKYRKYMQQSFHK